MSKYIAVVLVAVVAIGLVMFFQVQKVDKSSAPEIADMSAPGSIPGGAATAYSGEVLETMNAGGYTYVYIDTGKEKIWAAGPETQVEQGSVVSFPAGMEMGDFHSDTLDRTFEKILFVAEIRSGRADFAGGSGGGSGGGAMPPNHPPITGSDAPDVDLGSIDVPEGGVDIAGVYAKRGDLVGHSVRVRGRVVKFTGNVMGKNWVHIRDGSGGDGSNDLTVTTTAIVNVGDLIVVEGNLLTDQDFGYGYKYDVLVEDATVKVEEGAPASGT